MAESIVDTFRRLVDESYKVAAYEAYGPVGVELLASLLQRVRQLLVHVPYEMLTTGVRVYVALDPSSPPTADGGARYEDFAPLSGYTTDRLTVVITGPTSNMVWFSEKVEVECVAPVLIYTYVHGQREDLEIDGKVWPVNDTPWACAMAVPSFHSLEKAMDRYVALNRIPSQCKEIASTWRDDSRLAFKPKPESTLRDSLLLALSYVLENAQVRPELNQGHTRPVDIEINWWDQKRSAIIEVKWLGSSGPIGSDRFPTSYDESRAIEGLEQLVGYLDLRDQTTSDVPVRGYIFVFDARRKDLKPDQTSISREDGLYFQMCDPPYPDEWLQRPDIGRAYRCFMEPICT